MAQNYTVSYGLSPNGPWTVFNTVAVTTDTVSGLTAATAYYFQIIVQDTVTGITGTPVISSPVMTSGIGTSPSGTTIPPATQLVDANLNLWTLVGGQIAINGHIDTSTTGVVLLLWFNNLIYQHVVNASFPAGNWWSSPSPPANAVGGIVWTNIGATDPRPAIGMAISTIPTEINNTAFTVSGTLTGFTAVPTLNYQDTISGVAGPFQALPAGATVSATTFSFTHPVISTIGTNNTVTVRDVGLVATTVSNLFPVISPPTITSITLSSNTFTALTNGATVGTLTANMSSGAFSGTFSLPVGVVNNANFTIVGNTLKANVATMAAGAYNVNVIATQAGITNSPFTQSNIALTATGIALNTPAVVASNLIVPWAMGFLPDGTILCTSRDPDASNNFNLNHINTNGTIVRTAVPNTVTTGAEGGLMGLAIDPNYVTNHFIYICHTRSFNGGFTANGNEVIRYVFNNNALTSGTILLTYASGGFHDGGGLGIGPDGKLYITTGNATNPGVEQNTALMEGKVLRINTDGTIPADNPFGNAVWTLGHRNPQGICWDNLNQCWISENGPSGEAFGSFPAGIFGNDKINLIIKGNNYGFPLVYGNNQTTINSVPSTLPKLCSGDNETWAPEGIAFYGGSIFFCALGGLGNTPIGTAALDQAVISGTTSLNAATKRFPNTFGRMRALVIGPDKLAYFSTSNGDGRGNGARGSDQIYKVSLDQFTALSTESIDGTTITTAGPTITNSIGEVWALNNGVITVNGTLDGTTANVIKLYYHLHRVYQENSALGWWFKTVSSDGWTATTDPTVA